MAQQATEKAIKAGLVLEQIEFRFGHDLGRLRELLPAGWDVQVGDNELNWLTQWAVESRYPHDAVARADDAARAVELAERVVNAVAELFGERAEK